MDRYHENREKQSQLHMDDFNRMNGSHRECGGLLIFMVHFVKMFVEKRCVVDAMGPIRRVILENQKN